jgi:hypothetical protein
MHSIANSSRWLLGIACLGAVMVFGITGLANYMANHEKGDVNQNAVYVEECGGCHLAYPPGLLPAISWREIMLGLSDHFEDNAEMDQESADEISQYLDRHALRMGRPSTMSQMLRNMPEDPPIRITELPAFVAAHDDVSVPQEDSTSEGDYLSRCAECHKDASKGEFDKDSTSQPSS